MPRLRLPSLRKCLLSLWSALVSGSRTDHPTNGSCTPQIPFLDRSANSSHTQQVPLLRLCPELILCIADHLDKEFKVLFSLACKRTYDILSSHFALKLDDQETRVKFLLYLELKFPDYLTCRACGRMFGWREYRTADYRCPCKRWPYYPLHNFEILTRGTHGVYFNRYILDLMIRARERGPEYGLPLRYLNGCTGARFPKLHRVGARWVDGGVMIAGYYSWILSTRDQGLRSQTNDLLPNPCTHLPYQTLDKLLDPASRDSVQEQGPPYEFPKARCRYCATDVRMRLQRIAKDEFRCEIEYWRNFGDRYPPLDAKQTLFPQGILPVATLDESAVVARDLEASFVKGKADDNVNSGCEFHCRYVD